ncbi:Tho complex subunit 7-domain-containing protein [Panaeolus papilionaceus]|nr:Tho complex subunit 7-domain-containing protein [Panaeolus papilionaceus]
MAAASRPIPPVSIPPLTAEEEDQVILGRINNDDRPLRRVFKKFHNYTSLSHGPLVPSLSANNATNRSAIDDAREAFLLELSTFELLLRKSAMICDAETRQVEEYQREKKRLDDEHDTLRFQIEELKTALDHAQMLRKRKIEYDSVAEKVNTLPSREELESSISSIENDIAAIRAEHETQNRFIHSQKSALDNIVSELTSLRFMGKEAESTSHPQTPMESPALELPDVTSVADSARTPAPDDVDDDKAMTDVPGTQTTEEPGEDPDIEMGEVEEDPKEKISSKKKSREEELEEGEATDASSELSEPPDD